VKSMRLRILVGIVLANGVGAAASFALLQGRVDDGIGRVMAVHVALLAVSSLIVWVGTSGREKAIARMAEFLRALSIGRNDGRLELSTYGDLEDVARAANEIAAAHSEREDPTVGNVKSKKRDTPVAFPTPEPARVGRLPSYPLRGVSPASGDAQGRAVEPKQTAASTPDRAASPPETAASGDTSGVVDDTKGLVVEKKRGPRRGVDSEHPEIGPVRVIQRRKPIDDAPAGEPVPKAAPPVESPPAATEPKAPSLAASPADPVVGESVPADAPAEPPSSAPAVDEADAASSKSFIDVLPAREIDSAPHPRPDLPSTASTAADSAPDVSIAKDSPVDDAGASKVQRSDESNDTTIDEAPPAATIPVTPADDERVLLRVLFDEYIRTKKAHDEPIVDLEFEAFATALSEERVKLIEAHRCRDVRFEIKVQGGEVSLLPRLIR
jgi:hypothetical protein